jgi:hypothetical protein
LEGIFGKGFLGKDSLEKKSEEKLERKNECERDEP